jgi:signal transduction histidine kinase
MAEQPVIIYIEDNHDNQRLVQRVLGARGYHVLIARDGVEGIALARDTAAVLVLVDIGVPGLDGYEIATRLRSMRHLDDTPIVALTADVSPGARERALVAGCDGYISKPIDPRQLPEQIGEFIEGKRDFLSPTVEHTMLRQYNQKVVERLEQRVRELMTANIELREVDRLKSQFLASLSHELRTPLTSLIGYLDLLSNQTLGEMTDLQHEALDVVRRNVDNLSRQLNNLLYLHEYRSSQLSLGAVRLNDIVQQTLQGYKHKATQIGIVLESRVETVAPIYADPLALELALTNLLDNAIKFTPPGGQVLLSLRDEPTQVVVQISDTGVGIPTEELEKIFLPFHRVDASLASLTPGNGIGLALVDHVIKAHGGTVTVQSEQDQGSTFTMTLPRR